MPTIKQLAKDIKKEETIVAWDPFFKFQPRITFNADQFETWQSEVLPLTKSLKCVKGLTEDTVKDRGIEVGKGIYLYRRELPTHVKCTPGFLSYHRKPWIERFGLKLMKPGVRLGYAYFDRTTSVPVLSRIDNLDRPWMSLTPNEVMTQRTGIRRAKGNVLVAGFGLGWFTKMVLARKQVKHVTVVDINGELMKKLGDEFPKDKVTFVHEDVWDHVKKHTDYDMYLFDIWDAFMYAGHDRTFQDFKRENPGKVWGWGDLQTYPITGEYF